MANPFAQYAAKQVQEPAVEQQSDNPFQQYAPKPAPTGQQKVSELGIPLPPVKEPEPIGRLESAGGAFMRGFGSIVASLPKAVGEGAVALANKFGDDPIWGNPEGLTPEDTASYKAGNAIDRWFNRFAVNPEYNEEFTSQLASGAGSMAGFLAGGFAGRAAKIPALATTMGLGATATGVEGVEDYLATLSDDEQADPEMRENAFALNAALGTSEGLPVSRILNRLDTMSGGGIKAILKEGVKGGLEELTQEVLQSVGQNAIASELLEYDKNRNLFTGTVEAGEVGFTLGFLLNTLAASIGSRRARRGAEPAADEGEIELPDIDPAAEQPIDAIGDVIELPDITAEDIEQAPPAAETAEGTQDQTGPAPGVGGEELAAEPITEEIEPVPEVNYFDNRLKRDIYRNRLQNVADELVEGGGIALVPDLNFVGGESDVRDAQGRPQAPMVRTPSLNPEWFQNLMSDSNYSMSVKKVQNAVTKAIAGDRLGVRQARVIGAMLDNIHGERMDSLAYAREQLNIAREARAKAQLPVADDWLFEEQEYPDDFDGLSRTFTELHDQAKNMDAALAGEVEALMESQMDDAAVLDAITKKFEEYNGRKITTSTEAYTQPEGAAEIPGAGAEPIAGIPAAEGIPAGVPAGDQLARAEPVPAERQLAEPVPAQPLAAPVEVPVAKKAPGKKQVKAKVPRETIKAQPSEGVTPEEKTILTQERRRKKQPGRKVERRLKGREERRKAWAYRKDVEEMTEAERKAAIEELRHDAMINELTGLGSRLAWEQIENKAFIAAIDADSLKYVNDTLGNKAGDELLVKIGKALKAEFGKDAYHISGDEFWIHSDSMDDLVISLGAVQDKLKTESATGPGGTITGLGFSYGVAETENVADRKMKTDKKTRQKEGLRVERGERPAGVVLKGEKAEKPAKKEKTLTVYHGSPFIFSKFDMSKIGTGEGAQAFGYGLYLAENKNVAADYQEKLGYKDIVRQFRSELPDDAEIEDIEGMLDDGGEFQPQIESVLIALRNDDWLGFDYPSQAITAAFKDIENFDPSPALIDAVKNYGKVYTVNLSEKDVDNMLDWDKQMDQQPKNVQAQFRDASGSFGRFDKLKGMQIYQRMANEQGGGKAASDLLLSLGVKGIKYLDQVSRKAGEGSRNLVIFDDSIVEIQEERKPEKRVSKKKTDLAGKVDEKAQAKKDAEVAAKKEQAKKEEAAEKYAGPPDLLTGGELEPDLFAPSKKETKKAVDKAAHEAATSPKNGKPEPTEAQKEYGNYKKGVIDSSVLPWLKGLKIMIENPAGSKRRTEWKALVNHYGYFQSTEAYDADEVDVFLGPDLAQEPELVHVVDQVHPDTGKPDEHKVMLGFKDEAAAKSAYMANYQKGWKGFSRIQSYLYADFKDKLTSGFFKNSTPARKLQKQPVKAKKPAKRAKPEEEYTEYNGLNISYEVETEDTGETFTVTVDAGVAMREVDARLTALKALRDCL